MDELRELALVWAIALALMVAGVAVAHYATDESHLPVAAGTKS